MPIGKQRFITELSRIFRFGIVGAIAALAYGAIAFAMVKTGVSNLIVATLVGCTVAATISYLGHLYFSFRVEPNHRLFLWRFMFTVVVTVTISLICTWLVTDVWGYPYSGAVIAVTLLTPGISYACSRFWVFMPGLKGQ